MIEIATERGFLKNLIIKDFIVYGEMAKVYAIADLMVLPSIHDPNPLSVVEALHSGLPIALSEMAGNVEEAITEGKNGWVLPVGDDDLYVEKLKMIFSSKLETLQEMGQASLKENSQFWSSELSIKNFLKEVGVV